jgi:hypothetical protein
MENHSLFNYLIRSEIKAWAWVLLERSRKLYVRLPVKEQQALWVKPVM